MQSKDILKRLGNNAGNLLTYLDKIFTSNNNIILFGFHDSGKTTLLNKLCGTSFEIKSTKVPQCAESIHKGDFIAIELPSYFSYEDQLIKYKINKTILSNIPIKMICFVVKFDRGKIDYINILKDIFKNYEDNIVIIITQSNNIKYIGEFEKEINEFTKFKRIIFSFKEKDNETLLYNNLMAYMSEMKNIPNMMIKSINLIDAMGSYCDNLIDEEIDNFSKTINLFREKSKEYKDNPEVQRALFFAFKSYKNKFLKKLSKSLITNDINFSDIDKLVLKLIYFCKMLKGEVFALITSLKVGLQFGIYSDSFDEVIRKCPYCGTLWTRYVGSSDIRCGMRENSHHDYLSEYPKNYMVKLFNDKLIVEEDKYHNKLKNPGK